MTRVLIAYGSKRGSTGEIAKAIGWTFEELGVEVDVRPAAEVEDVVPYEAVVLGGAVYMNRWHRDARRFGRRFAGALRERPVWLFSSGPLDLTAEERNVPPVPFVAKLAERPRGLVLVTGPTGSGKSTTLAAMIDLVNSTHKKHIITLEDPIEFIHKSKSSLVNQREVGPHTKSFAAALRAALREDPNVILVGEMRDLETIRLAMTAAETGHLVFGTLHTSSAAKTIDRIIDVFPAEEKEMVRAMLSESLRAVISQTLCKTKDGAGRVAAHEIMIGTPAIRNLIRENKVAQMYSAIQTGQGFGMQTLDQNLQDLWRRNIITVDEARGKAANKDNFK